MGGAGRPQPDAAAQGHQSRITQRRQEAKTQPNCAKRLECAELAPAFGRPPPSESASPSSVATLRRVDKLVALHTLRESERQWPITRLQHSLAVRASEIILHFHLVNLEAVDRFDLGRGGRSLEPGCRAPDRKSTRLNS